MSGYSIDITLWGDHYEIVSKNLAELHSLDFPPIIVVKGGHVVEFNGWTIGTISTSNISKYS